MAISADVVASALQDLSPKFTELFLKGIPLFSYIVGSPEGNGAKGGLSKYKLKGPYKEFIVLKGGVGDSTGIRQGNELLRSQRRQQALRGNEYSFLHIYHYDIPGKDLAEASGPMDLGKIIDSYPEIAVADDKALVSKQIARGASSAGSTGVSAGASGFFTLNGNQSYDPQGTSRTGLFQYKTPSTQTATVHGIPMAGAASSPTAGWFHQFANISSFALDGMRQYRLLVAKANQEGLTLTGGGVNLVCSDIGTYNNMLEHMDDKITMIDKAGYPLAKHLNREGFKVGNVDWYWDPDIDITDTTAFTSAEARLGVAYVLNTSKFDLLIQANHADIVGNGLFDMRQPVPIPDQFAWQFRIVSNFNICCTSLRHQGVLTGGSVE